MKNIELKVKVGDITSVREKLVDLGARKEGVLHQVDTYFHTHTGRLKLRAIGGERHELIYYERPDEHESKVSTYEIVVLHAGEADKVKNMLSATNGIMVVVEKERELWIHKHTRIHLDKVVGLGEYVELETVVHDMSMSEAQAEHVNVISSLVLEQYEKCDVSYSDLLQV